MTDEFILSHNFRDYMQEAVDICVASNFLSRAIVDDIKSTLSQLPFSGGRNFRFLLNEDFHEDPSMRKVLVNMLLELPNAEVRIHEGPRRFHAKVYIFESGNTMFAAVGSFNATAGGAGGNIEAGVKLTNRALVRDARAFFEKYWDSEETRVATVDESAVFVRKKFRPGDLVIQESSGEQGVILAEQPLLSGATWTYTVLINATIKKVPEDDLRAQKIAYFRDEDKYLHGETGIRADKWIMGYLIRKALDLTDRTLLSYASTRTLTFEYQFRPLFKILRSRERRLLIADEVGLGKTIEAGIILKELSSRSACKRVLIIVPNALKTKWRDELQIRFDEYFDVLSYRNVLSFMKSYEVSGDTSALRGIITYDQLVSTKLRSYLDRAAALPSLDAVIIDEAHHLKNPNTHRHRVIAKLVKNAKALVMLTATPIQLMTQDLYNLLSILLPDHFFALDSKAFSAKLTLNERINEAIRLLAARDFDAFHGAIEELRRVRHFAKQLSRIGDFKPLAEKCLSLDASSNSGELRRVATEIYGFNILNTYMTRTLRKDVAESFPDRVIKTFEYEYSAEERELCDRILESYRAAFDRGNASFGLMVPERRAASSLIALSLSMNREDWRESVEEYCDNYEAEVEGDVSAAESEVAVSPAGWVDSKISGLRDSKLEMLVDVINGVFEENPDVADRKVLIFCAFRATIVYLREMLSNRYPGCYVDSIYGEDEILTRDQKRRRFSRNDSEGILICSEVAGEGLDFQFCHYLVNYDMPWNPSKLEQRVGRIDRIGQKAEKITVINLVNKDTIEDRIMARLFERVKLFNSAIGPLGDLLSKYQKDFKSSVLSPKRSSEERDAYEKKLLENLEAKEEEQAEFEKKEAAIVGAMDSFQYESRPKPGYFTEDEVSKLWLYTLGHLMSDRKPVAHDMDDEKVFSLSLNADVRGLLVGLVEGSPVDRFNPKKRRHYNELIEALFQSKKPLRYTFSQEKALQDLDIEHITMTHPFLQGGLQELKHRYDGNRGVLGCSFRSSVVEPGIYVVSVYRFTVINCTSGAREYVDERYLCISMDSAPPADPWHAGESVFHALMSSAVLSDLEISGVDDVLSTHTASIDANVRAMADSLLASYTEVSDERLRLQRQSIVEFYDDKKAMLRKELAFMHDEAIRANHKAEILRLDDELVAQVERFELSELSISVKCSGIIYAEVI